MADTFTSLAVDVVALPPWAVVAFAARCAERVLPAIFQGAHLHMDRILVPQFYTIWATQEAAATATVPPKPPAEVQQKAVDGIKQMDEWIEGSSAIRTAALAYKMAKAAPAGSAGLTRELTNLLRLVQKVGSNYPTLLQAVQRDAADLAAAAKKGKWTDDIGVSQSVFGPLWIEPPPSHWVVDSPYLAPGKWQDYLEGEYPWIVLRRDTPLVHLGFASRCVHRILPLLYQHPDQKICKLFGEGAWIAATFAADPENKKIQAELKKFADMTAKYRSQMDPFLPWHVQCAICAVMQSLWLGMGILKQSGSTNIPSAKLTMEYTALACDCMGTNVEELQQREWDQVRSWAVEHQVNPTTPVPQTVFGPLWPDKKPAKPWPEPSEIDFEAFRDLSWMQPASEPIPAVQELPLWAELAYCLRILRRATPWVLEKQGRHLTPAHVEVLHKYLDFWAKMLARADASKSTLAELDQIYEEWVKLWGAIHGSTATAILMNFLFPVAELQRQLRPLLSRKNLKEHELGIAASRCKRFADQYTRSLQIRGFSILAAEEYLRLKQQAAAESWTNTTPVPLEKCGPLWPEGAPKWWPRNGPTC